MQIPDVRTGDDVIDAVVVDEEAVGSKGCGSGAKILYSKGALDRYLSQQKLKDLEVCMSEHYYLCDFAFRSVSMKCKVANIQSSVFQTTVEGLDREAEVETELPSVVASM